MAVTGTTTFALASQDIILAALRVLAVYGPQDTVPAAEMTTALQALNIIAKEFALQGLPLWKVEQVSIPTVAGQASYNLSTASASTLPLRILDAMLVDTTVTPNSQVQLQILSRYDFDKLGMPAQSGVPNQIYYNPQLGSGQLIVFPVPTVTTYNIVVVAQQQIDDFNALTDSPDFPQEALLMLKWRLADELALEYVTDARARAEIHQKAAMYAERFFASTQEQASIIFSPNRQGQR